MSVTVELNALLKKRTIIKAALTRFENYLHKFNEVASRKELKARFLKAQNLLNEFNDIQSEIEINDFETNYEEERVEFERKYYEVILKCEEMLEQQPLTDASTSADTGSEPGVTVNDSIRLPTLNLQSYDGSYENWQSFKDTFDAMINQNAKLNKIQRFRYLQSCLTGKAAETIQSIQASNDNFDIAWQMLNDRFDNKKLTVFSHIKSIVELPVLNKESSVMLRNLYDEYLKHFRALKVLGEPVDSWGSLLIYLVVSKFDHATRKCWETETNSKNIPTLLQLDLFLGQRCQLLETITNKECHTNKNSFGNNKNCRTASTYVSDIKNMSCFYCKGQHTIFKCKKFLDLGITVRKDEARRLNLCFLCLGKHHRYADCKARHCKMCNGKHNFLLHQDTERRNTETTSDESSQQVTGHTTQDYVHVLLCTAIVLIDDGKGNSLKVRALLDSGSTANYVTENLARKLNLKVDKKIMKITGVNNASSWVDGVVTATVVSNQSNYSATLSFLVIDKVTGKIPTSNLNKLDLKIPKHIDLADPGFHVSSNVEMLLGAQIFYELILNGRVSLGTVVLRESKLGWLVTGTVPAVISPISHRCCLSANDIHDSMERWWKLEEISEENDHNLEELECERSFKQFTKQTAEGRFTVRYPTNGDFTLGDSFSTALKRFLNMERKLENDKTLKTEYVTFLDEYEKTGHMTKIGYIDKTTLRPPCEDSNKNVYYIPHHAVHKADSCTTKLRVVFDASAKTSNGLSLNDILLNGPTIQSDLFTILLRFREYNIVLSADIKQMFRQVLVEEKQRDWQRILWRIDKDDEIGIFRLNTVTYGLKPATYLSTRCIAEIASQYKEIYPTASNIILKNTYVDDITFGADSIIGALKLKEEVMSIFKAACFELRKWRSNSQELLKESGGDIRNDKHFIKDDSEIKTLGLVWDSKEDLLKFVVNINLQSERITKRLALSLISRIFDPLGVIGPITVRAKLFMQSLWALKLSWDEFLPEDLQDGFTKLMMSFKDLSKIEIPRCVVVANYVSLQIHGFCDASVKAYGAAIYLRSEDSLGNVKTELMCSKSRVAPLKECTLPRLELCGAVLLSHLVDMVSKHLNSKVVRTYLWTDSSIVLFWIKSDYKRFKPFVANRISKIQTLTKAEDWMHVAGKDNPADLLSRGTMVSVLVKSYWFNGPVWLSMDNSIWPHSRIQLTEGQNEFCEYRKTQVVTLLATEDKYDILERFSDIKTLIRVIAWCKRFVNNCTKSGKKNSSNLNADEFDSALSTVLRLTQEQVFHHEIECLQNGRQISKRSKISELNPFLDELNLLRVGGRLRNSNYAFNKKHPIILPKGHIVTRLIIRSEHLKHLHLGAQALLASLRENYWPVSGLNAVKGVLRNCTICFKFNPRKAIEVKMGDLPSNRIEIARPFRTIGVDFAGPFHIKETKHRNKKIIKAYVAVFVCFCTKAVHIDIVSDLTAEAFLNCFRRFAGRRGVPSYIYSDNATNFVACNRELQSFFNSQINDWPDSVQRYFIENKIKWHFMPARTPHFGGLHESGIKSLKKHLLKVMHGTVLTVESLSTVLCQIEAILNSRPLYPMSNDPNDLSALTPGHFLVGEPLTALPQSNVSEAPRNALDTFKQLQYRLQLFWKTWSKHYLCTLQTRSKWRQHKSSPVKKGMLVLLRDENLPPQCWRLGRIADTHPGKDGIVRVVSVKISSGVVTRGVARICPLPLETQSFRPREDGGNKDGEPVDAHAF